MSDCDANVVVGMRETEVSSVFVGPMDERGRITEIVDKIRCLADLRRQGQRKESTMNGALYLMRWSHFASVGSRYTDRERTYGYPMDRFHSIEIDEPVDLEWARYLVSSGLVDVSEWRVDALMSRAIE
jgi:CMP-N-acetylneuraminic acid synthetase